jgi:hypothetical protein
MSVGIGESLFNVCSRLCYSRHRPRIRQWTRRGYKSIHVDATR